MRTGPKAHQHARLQPAEQRLTESFVNTFKRDYVARMDLRDALTAQAQLPAAFEHFNEMHPP
jgi:putative transposase